MYSAGVINSQEYLSTIFGLEKGRFCRRLSRRMPSEKVGLHARLNFRLRPAAEATVAGERFSAGLKSSSPC